MDCLRREYPLPLVNNEEHFYDSNVHALELGRASKCIDVGRPDRADVEAAFRTIIRWAGDDPERPGLIETPARVARAFDEFFAGYGRIPR